MKSFFPKTTLSYSPEGKVLKNSAPDLQLPVRLPGLDVKRLPETIFMPVEFPAGGYELGKAFTYEKDFDDSKVHYTVTPQKLEGNTLSVLVTTKQEFEILEDEAKALTKNSEDAAWRVKTTANGKGTATFDVSGKFLKEMNLVADSESIASPLQGGSSETRKLKTTLKVTRK